MHYRENPKPDTHTHKSEELLPDGEVEKSLQLVHVLLVCAKTVE